MRILFILGVVAVIMSGCGATGPLKSETYKSLYDEKPLSILALPPINKSTKVEAKELFYSSVVGPLAEKGFSVMPPVWARFSVSMPFCLQLYMSGGKRRF